MDPMVHTPYRGQTLLVSTAPISPELEKASAPAFSVFQASPVNYSQHEPSPAGPFAERALKVELSWEAGPGIWPQLCH